MMNKFNEVNTRLVYENNNSRFIWESPYNDVSMEDILNALYGVLVADTWLPVTVIECMKEFVDEHSYLLSKDNDEDNIE